MLFPGAFLTLAVLGFVMLGDAVRDALDPKLR
jgi:oligopeptide transport system permease protein